MSAMDRDQRPADQLDRHRGREAFASLKDHMPLTYAALRRSRPLAPDEPDLWYAYNDALVWRLSNGIEVTVWDRRVEIGFTHVAAQLIVAEPSWKMTTGEYDQVVAHLIASMATLDRTTTQE